MKIETPWGALHLRIEWERKYIPTFVWFEREGAFYWDYAPYFNMLRYSDSSQYYCFGPYTDKSKMILAINDWANNSGRRMPQRKSYPLRKAEPNNSPAHMWPRS